MTQIELLPIDLPLKEAIASRQDFTARYNYDLGDLQDILVEVIDATLRFEDRVEAKAPWNGYLTACLSTKAIVGCGGFKGPPTEAGSVEIAYATFSPHEGKGYGKATAKALTQIAADDRTVYCILAHTLRDGAASQAILRHIGFDLLGEVRDPEDGIVLRWQSLTQPLWKAEVGSK